MIASVRISVAGEVSDNMNLLSQMVEECTGKTNELIQMSDSLEVQAAKFKL